MPHIPFHEPEPGGLPDLAAIEADRLEVLMATARRIYGRPVLRVGDRLSRRWMERAANPYAAEIAAVARTVGAPGAWMLNLSLEWTCTAAATVDPEHPTPRLLRTLDWFYAGLGSTMMVVLQHGPAGHFLSLTWPGFVGVLTAMAPGRFAVALNQPPLTRRSGLRAFDWLLDRWAVGRSRALPPSHLLRRVCEACTDYDSARRMLTETEVCLPVFYTLVGAAPNEGCVIERTPTEAGVLPFPSAAANHYVAMPRTGHGRGWDSPGRLARMESHMATADNGFDWVAPPILNKATRLSVIANPGAGTLLAQGWEDMVPATEPFRL